MQKKTGKSVDYFAQTRKSIVDFFDQNEHSKTCLTWLVAFPKIAKNLVKLASFKAAEIVVKTPSYLFTTTPEEAPHEHPDIEQETDAHSDGEETEYYTADEYEPDSFSMDEDEDKDEPQPKSEDRDRPAL